MGSHPLPNLPLPLSTSCPSSQRPCACQQHTLSFAGGGSLLPSSPPTRMHPRLSLSSLPLGAGEGEKREKPGGRSSKSCLAAAVFAQVPLWNSHAAIPRGSKMVFLRGHKRWEHGIVVRGTLLFCASLFLQVKGQPSLSPSASSWSPGAGWHKMPGKSNLICARRELRVEQGREGWYSMAIGNLINLISHASRCS